MPDFPSISVTTPGGTTVPVDDHVGIESQRPTGTETTGLSTRGNTAAPPPRLNNLPVETMHQIVGYLADNPADVTALASSRADIRAQIFPQAQVARLEQRAASVTTFAEVRQLLNESTPATAGGMLDAIVQLPAQQQPAPLTTLARRLSALSSVDRAGARSLVEQAVSQLPQDLQAGPMAAMPANSAADSVRAAFPRTRLESPIRYARRLAGLAATGNLPVGVTITDVAAVTGISPRQLQRDPQMNVFRR
jgi:hypothetical protein